MLGQKQCVVPKVKTLEYLLPLLRGVWNHAENKPASGTAVRNWLKTKGTLQINGEPADPEEILDYPIWSIVLFPKAPERRVTIW